MNQRALKVRRWVWDGPHACPAEQNRMLGLQVLCSSQLPSVGLDHSNKGASGLFEGMVTCVTSSLLC